MDDGAVSASDPSTAFASTAVAAGIGRADATCAAIKRLTPDATAVALRTDASSAEGAQAVAVALGLADRAEADDAKSEATPPRAAALVLASVEPNERRALNRLCLAVGIPCIALHQAADGLSGVRSRSWLISDGAAAAVCQVGPRADGLLRQSHLCSSPA